MSTNVARFRHADPRRVRRFPVGSATVINLGDLVYQAGNAVLPASSFTYVTGQLGRTQANFRRDFMGVALTSHANGGPETEVVVAQEGTFEFDCAAATFSIGDRVGPDDNAAGDTLLSQTVIGVAAPGYGEIGKVVKRYAANTASVLVELTAHRTRALSSPQIIFLAAGSTTTAGDLVTNLMVEWPFVVRRWFAIVTAAYTGTDVLTLKNGVTSIAQTVSITGAIGAVVAANVTDAARSFKAGDTLSVSTDGASTSGSASVFIEVVPFLHAA